ncbi:hypothetical protein [Clostridium estertheticum]|uniref:hypothetical protein n=1 Tax=Clostridium estertheticum TaxID=238834 RepID=UPI001C6EDEB4|nr:hypothetical protein [Clostridium estertheticum]MBW9154722.1 hypothetical protein [Clostridium estertheticum]WLC82771.1 hypothetical protein KTC97_11560 [Clostridium estertheticum]
MIRWSKPNRIGHFELVEHIKNNYYDGTISIVKNIRDNLSNTKIKDIIDGYDDTIINPMIKELLYVFLVRRRKKIIDIYYGEEEAEE